MATETNRDVGFAPAAAGALRAPGRPLRVLYVMNTAAAGGSAGSLRFLVESFPRGAVETAITTPPGEAHARFAAAGVRVFPIHGISMFHSIAGVPLRGTRLLELIRTVWLMHVGGRLREIIAEWKPDIVHLNERGMLHAARVASRAGCAVVLHARSVTDRDTRWVWTLANKWVDRYVDRVIAIDESVRWSMREVERVEVIYNPLDAHRDDIPHASRTEPGVLRVTFLSGLIPFKGIRDLVEAAHLLRDRSDIRFQIAGANSRPREFHESLLGLLTRTIGLTHDMERELQDAVQRHDLGGTVRLEGHVHDISELLDRTDVLVFPSHLNGVGRSVYEAGARGIPSIVSLKDRLEDIVVDGETGLLVPERDPASLAKAIERLADDPALRAQLGENARQKYVEQFDATRSAERVLALYRAVLAERGAPSESA